MKKLLSFLSIILFYACHSKDTSQETIESGGNRIAYSICGDGDTTLLFVHGWCINKEYWASQGAYFCPRFKVVAIDLPGFGQSGKSLDSNWNFSHYAEDVNTVMEKLQLENVVLIGHSMSGDIILDVSRRFPDRLIGIVGIDNLHQPAGPFGDTVKQQVNEFFDLFYQRYDSIVNATVAKDLFQPSTDTAIRKRVMSDILSTDKKIATTVLRQNTLYGQEQKQAMQQLHHPLWLLNSDVYPVNTDSLRKYCNKGFRLETVHGSGHYPMVEMPEAFNKALEALVTGKK